MEAVVRFQEDPFLVSEAAHIAGQHINAAIFAEEIAIFELPVLAQGSVVNDGIARVFHIRPRRITGHGHPVFTVPADGRVGVVVVLITVP